MSSLSDLLTTSITYWEYRAVESATGTITIDPTSSTTSTWVSGGTAAPVVVVEFHGEIDIPLTCDAIYWFNASDYDSRIHPRGAKSGHCRTRGKPYVGNM
jgi:hypothetical protein